MIHQQHFSKDATVWLCSIYLRSQGLPTNLERFAILIGPKTSAKGSLQSPGQPYPFKMTEQARTAQHLRKGTLAKLQRALYSMLTRGFSAKHGWKAVHTFAILIQRSLIGSSHWRKGTNETVVGQRDGSAGKSPCSSSLLA